ELDRLGLSDRPRLLEAPQRRIERAERDSPERTERLRKPFLQLIAVKRLLGEQSENGELEHGLTPVGGTGGERPEEGSGPLSSYDISKRYIDATTKWIVRARRRRDSAGPTGTPTRLEGS